VVDKELIQQIFGDEINKAAAHMKYDAVVEIVGIDVRFISRKVDNRRVRWLVTLDGGRWRMTLSIQNHYVMRRLRHVVDDIVYIRGNQEDMIEDFAAMRLLVA
jgi:hypothetical protein